MRKHIAVLIVALLSLTHLGAPKSHAADMPSVEKFVEYFDLVAFRSEYKTTRSPHLLRKWPGPTIPFKMAGLKKFADRYRPMITEHSKSLSVWGAPKFVEIPGQKKGEKLIINFATTATMIKAGQLIEKNMAVLKNMAKGSCYFLSYHDDGGNLIYGMIVVNTEFPTDHIHHCLLEEMAQSLGLPNDSKQVSPSIFNDSQQRHKLSVIDKVLIRTLYDPKMKAGMPRQLALKTAGQVITELMQKVRKK